MPEASEAIPTRRRGWGGALLVLVLGGAVAAGPRARVAPEAPLFDASLAAHEVDAYLARQEARYDDLTPGVAKSVVWAEGAGVRTPLAVVYLHGFSATSMETRPVPERVAEQLGANLFRTRLRGHGRPGDALGEAGAEDWLRDVAEAMTVAEALGDRTVLLGTSTGGTLALWAATRPLWKDRIAAVVVMSPNLGPRDSRAGMLLWPWGGALARIVVGSERSWEPLNPDQARYWTTRYPTEALLSMMALVDMVSGVPSSELGAPVLNLYSPHDRVVSPERVEAWARGLDDSKWRARQVAGSDDPDQHVLAGDILSPGSTEAVLEEVVRFLDTALDTPTPRGMGSAPTSSAAERMGQRAGGRPTALGGSGTPGPPH